MGAITVTSEKVPGGYIATATNGQAYTTTHRQNTAEDAERVAVRLFKDGVIDGYYHSGDMHSENTDEVGGYSPASSHLRIVPSTWKDDVKDLVVRFLLISGLIAVLVLGVINFLISLVPVE